MIKKKLNKAKVFKTIPNFKNEDEERVFWDKVDSSDYFDFNKMKHVKFVNLKPSTETISLRMPASLLDEIRVRANKQDVPYQSLIKTYLNKVVYSE